MYIVKDNRKKEWNDHVFNSPKHRFVEKSEYEYVNRPAFEQVFIPSSPLRFIKMTGKEFRFKTEVKIKKELLLDIYILASNKKVQ